MTTKVRIAASAVVAAALTALIVLTVHSVLFARIGTVPVALGLWALFGAGAFDCQVGDRIEEHPPLPFRDRHDLSLRHFPRSLDLPEVRDPQGDRRRPGGVTEVSTGIAQMVVMLWL